MSQQLTEERLGDLEKGQSKLTADFRVMSHDLQGVKTDIADLKGQGTEQTRILRTLENRAASQPTPITGKGFLQMIGSVGIGGATLFGIIWFIIQIAPSVSSLGDRLNKLDDPEIGKVTTLNDRVRRLEEGAGVPTVPRHHVPPQEKKSQMLSLPF